MFCLIHVSSVFSQAAKERGNISITVGAAMPVGQFASTALLDSKSGFAKTGESLSLSYSRPIAKTTSLIVHIQAQRNPINKNAFENSFSQLKIYQGFYAGSGQNNPPPQTSYKIYPGWKFEKKSWLYRALLLGAQKQFKPNSYDKINLFAKIMAGAMYAQSPELNGKSFSDTATANFQQSKSSAFGFVYSFGGGFNYTLTKTVFLTSALAYFGSNKIVFKDVKTTFTTTKGTFGSPEYSVQQSATTGNGKQAISSVNVAAGIGFKL